MMISMMLMFIYLTYLSVWDIRMKKVPSGILVVGISTVFITVLAGSVMSGPPAESIRVVFVSLLGALPGLMMTLLSFYSDKVGRADGPVFIAVGLAESCTFSGILMCVSCLLLAAVSGCLMLMGKVRRNTHMPYIPFVTVGYVILKLMERSGIFI